MNKEIKYLYIDDRKDGDQSILSLREPGRLSIDVIQPPREMKIAIAKINDYDGLIVDQQLDEVVIDDNKKSDYLGGALAMDIRTVEYKVKTIDRKDIGMPIVLYSANENLELMMYGFGESIFDLMLCKAVNKFGEFEDLFHQYREQLISLVKGYQDLQEKKSVECLNFADMSKIDRRFLDELQKRDNLTIHSKASFILNELIIHQGILISEEILAVRLGIDKDESKEGWLKVLSSLKEFGAEYQGIFCEGWPRWWMPMVKEWWYKNIDSETYIRFYDAKQRAELISEKLELKEDLIPAKAESEFSIHTDYWTICDFSKEPLDIEDGLMLAGQEDLYPWQDAKYVSIHSALEESIEVAEGDKEVLENFKK